MLSVERTDIVTERIGSYYNPYLNETETTLLVSLVKSVNPKVMIEIGCNTGRTAKTLLQLVASLETYIGIDVPWEHIPTLTCQRGEVPYTPGLYAVDDRFYLLVREGGSLALGPQDLEPCDACFIDGDHSEYAVRHDTNLARALVRPGGIIVWHDYGNPSVEVTRALHWFSAQGWPIQSINGSWLAFMKIPQIMEIDLCR